MLAALYRAQGPAREVLRIEEMPTPAPADGEVRVKLAFSGVNPSDVKTRAGKTVRATDYEFVVPHSDGAGVVDAAGAAVAADWVNQRVWVFNGQWDRSSGTAAQYITVPVQQVVPLPGGVSFEVGASIGIPLMTAYHAVTACGNLLAKVVIVPGAAGAVGQYITQLAKLAGASVIALVSNEKKAEIARASGANEAVNYRTEDAVARVKQITRGHGADFIIDLDAAAYAGRYPDLLGFGGKAILYGSSKSTVSVPFRPMIASFVSLYFFVVYRLSAEQRRETTAGITRLLEGGLLRHPPIEPYELRDIASAHERVESGAEGKVLIRIPS